MQEEGGRGGGGIQGLSASVFWGDWAKTSGGICTPVAYYLLGEGGCYLDDYKIYLI